MIYINKKTWPRRDYFKFFSSAHNPHFSITANIKVGKLLKLTKKHNLSFYHCFIYFVGKTINQIEEFKVRVKGEKIIKHSIIHPSFTVLGKNNKFNFCTTNYTSHFSNFLKNAKVNEEKLLNLKTLYLKEESREDVFYNTCLPWVSFTAITHSMHNPKKEYIPRLAWGKYFKEKSNILMPFSIQAHHGLVDGLHVGTFFELIEHEIHSSSKIMRD